MTEREARLIEGDCIEAMRQLPDGSVHAVVTDPPYGLEFMGKDWDRFADATPRKRSGWSHTSGSGKIATPEDTESTAHGRVTFHGRRKTYVCSACGARDAFAFARGKVHACVEGAEWLAEWVDATPLEATAFQAWTAEWAREAFRVLRPGGHLLAFGGTRTYHRLAAGIEDAGFEIRDTLGWIYGQGFPKSLDVSKAIDKAAGAEREVTGTRRRPGGPTQLTAARGWNAGPMAHDDAMVDVTEPATEDAARWQGWGTALKPAWEPIVMARRPLVGSVARNVLAHGTGALNIDGARIPSEPPQRAMSDPANRTGGVDMTTWSKLSAEEMQRRQNAAYDRQEQLGRWPSNVLLSDPELFDEPNPYIVGSGATASDSPVDATMPNRTTSSTNLYGNGRGLPLDGVGVFGYGDVGGYARFFIIPKANRAERERGLEGRPQAQGAGPVEGHRGRRIEGDVKLRPDGTVSAGRANTHPTVKPVDLMRHLCRLVTPPGGVVLDPFLGSGTTALACEDEGFGWIGIERDPEYVAIARGRIDGNTQRSLGLATELQSRRAPARGHWPRTRPAGRDGWGFSGQIGLDEFTDGPPATTGGDTE